MALTRVICLTFLLKMIEIILAQLASVDVYGVTANLSLVVNA